MISSRNATRSWSPAVTSGSNVPMEELPIIQRRTVMRCIQTGRQVIVATHMLESMIENPCRPARKSPTSQMPSSNRRDAIMLERRDDRR